MLKTSRIHGAKVFLLAALAVFFGTLPYTVWAHCDAESGPVATAAKKALETGNFDAIAIWVGEGQERELRNRFEETLSVYKMGGKAKTLAERYFLETSVRLHREAEGMPYKGLKPAQPLPSDIAKAEKALETGNPELLADFLSEELEREVRKWFQKAYDAKKTYNMTESVESGRKWVDAYVKYVIYAHGLYKAIQAGPEHGVGHNKQG